MKLSLYFIFYVAMILELLIFIMERDEATDRVDADIKEMSALADTLTSEFNKHLEISVPSNSSALVYTPSVQRAFGRVGDSSHVILSPVGLWGDEERKTVDFEILDSAGAKIAMRGNASPFRLEPNGSTGNAVFHALFSHPGVYKFFAKCSVRRAIPKYYPSYVRESVTAKLRKALGASMLVATKDPVPFSITVRMAGATLPPCPRCGFAGWK
jgi:hypothetical protein